MKGKLMWSKTANVDYFVEENVEILNTPRGEGDMIQVKCENGEQLYLNPYHPWLLGIKIAGDRINASN